MNTRAAVTFAAKRPLEAVELEGPKAGEVLVEIREDAPFRTSCHIDCGVTTGIGAGRIVGVDLMPCRTRHPCRRRLLKARGKAAMHRDEMVGSNAVGGLTRVPQ